MVLKGKLILIIALLVMFAVSGGGSLAHVCNDVLLGGSQHQEGCDPIDPSRSSHVVNGNEITFKINVAIRSTPYSPATSCGNPWSNSWIEQQLFLDSCSPNCNGFSVDISPSSNVRISNGNNQDYDVTITVNDA